MYRIGNIKLDWVVFCMITIILFGISLLVAYANGQNQSNKERLNLGISIDAMQRELLFNQYAIIDNQLKILKNQEEIKLLIGKDRLR